MIYTVTLNPSIDYVVHMDSLVSSTLTPRRSASWPESRERRSRRA